MDEVLITMKGATKLTIMSVKEDNLPKGHLILDEICKQLALNRYGTGASQIKTMILNMSNDGIDKWLADIWDVFISDDDILNIYNRMIGVKTCN